VPRALQAAGLGRRAKAIMRGPVCSLAGCGVRDVECGGCAGCGKADDTNAALMGGRCAAVARVLRHEQHLRAGEN